MAQIVSPERGPGHRHGRRHSRGPGQRRPPFLVELYRQRPGQEVRHGRHRHHLDGLRAAPTWSATSRRSSGRRSSTTTPSSSASSWCRSCPRTVTLWLLRLGAHRRDRAAHPRRDDADHHEPQGPPGALPEPAGLRGRHLRQPHHALHGRPRPAVPLRAPRRPDVGVVQPRLHPRRRVPQPRRQPLALVDEPLLHRRQPGPLPPPAATGGGASSRAWAGTTPGSTRPAAGSRCGFAGVVVVGNVSICIAVLVRRDQPVKARRHR